MRTDYPGGSIGGPVLIPGTNFNKSRKLLFWVGYEYFWQNLGSSSPLQSYVPTPAMRAGNFPAHQIPTTPSCALQSGGITSARTDFCNNLAGTIAANGTPITGSQIPTTALDSGALALFKLFPAREPGLQPPMRLGTTTTPQPAHNTTATYIAFAGTITSVIVTRCMSAISTVMMSVCRSRIFGGHQHILSLTPVATSLVPSTRMSSLEAGFISSIRR